MTGVHENGGLLLDGLGYDELGRRVSLARSNGVVTRYGYDGASRLTSLVQDLAGTAQDQSETFAYNVASQVTSRTASNDGYAWNNGYNVNRPYTLNRLNEPTVAGPDMLTWSAKGTLATDATSTGSITYAYDAENKLFSVSNGATESYDGSGRLYAVGAGGATRFAYDGSDAIAEYNTSGGVLRRYVFGPAADEPLVWYEGASTTARYGLASDRQGSVTAVTNDSGAAQAINSYDEYGLPGTANMGRFGYTGQMYLSEVGLYNYKAREYSPTLGRFLQPDPIGYGDGMNFYQYVGSDPVNNFDPRGLEDTTVEEITVTGHQDDGRGSDPAPEYGDGPGYGYGPPQSSPNSPNQVAEITVIATRRPPKPQNAKVTWGVSSVCPGGTMSQAEIDSAMANAAAEANMPTEATRGKLGMQRSGNFTSRASQGFRSMTGDTKFGPLRPVTGTNSVGGSLARALPFLGAVVVVLDALVYAQQQEKQPSDDCIPVA